MVSDLINENNREWRKDVITSLFAEDDADRILKISLLVAAQDDAMVWGGEPSSEFVGRSTYKILQTGHMAPILNDIQTASRNFYKQLWSLAIPSKIKMIIWCILENYIPTLANLHYRRLVASMTCPRCAIDAENTHHVFRSCPIAQEVWRLIDLPIIIQHMNQDVLSDLYGFSRFARLPNAFTSIVAFGLYGFQGINTNMSM